MERHFDEQLADLKHRLVRMSALAEHMINAAVRVLVARDASAGEPVPGHEDEVNRMQIDIDEFCLQLIALHQPTAGDLRFILAATKSASDIERLADQAVNVLKKAERLLTSPPLAETARIEEMAALASRMLSDSLHSFVNRDVGRAREVLLRDDQLDEMKSVVTDELIARMGAEPSAVVSAVDLLLVARNLERIGDHATNIAENTIFAVEGRDVRHHAEDRPEPPPPAP
jgi:phosphate transport system protein